HGGRRKISRSRSKRPPFALLDGVATACVHNPWRRIGQFVFGKPVQWGIRQWDAPASRRRPRHEEFRLRFLSRLARIFPDYRNHDIAGPRFRAARLRTVSASGRAYQRDSLAPILLGA